MGISKRSNGELKFTEPFDTTFSAHFDQARSLELRKDFNRGFAEFAERHRQLEGYSANPASSPTPVQWILFKSLI